MKLNKLRLVLVLVLTLVASSAFAENKDCSSAADAAQKGIDALKECKAKDCGNITAEIAKISGQLSQISDGGKRIEELKDQLKGIKDGQDKLATKDDVGKLATKDDVGKLATREEVMEMKRKIPRDCLRILESAKDMNKLKTDSGLLALYTTCLKDKKEFFSDETVAKVFRDGGLIEAGTFSAYISTSSKKRGYALPYWTAAFVGPVAGCLAWGGAYLGGKTMETQRIYGGLTAVSAVGISLLVSYLTDDR